MDTLSKKLVNPSFEEMQAAVEAELRLISERLKAAEAGVSDVSEVAELYRQSDMIKARRAGLLALIKGGR